MDKLKVGIAGFGVVGKQRKRCADAHHALEVVAVCDRTFSGTGIGPDGVRQYRTTDELLRETLDILFVCITNDIAADVTIAGLNAGLHVFCEKPPGRNVTEVERVVAVEKAHPSQRLMYGFNHRYHESVQDALQIIRTAKLGRIINMRGVYGKSKLVTFNQSDWRTRRDIAGGGVLLDQGIHLVDLMRLFAGEFTEVHSFISNNHWGFDVEDNAYALMRTRDGIVAQLNSSATQWRHMFNLEISLERGALVLSGILTGSKSYGQEMLTIITVDHQNDSGDPREQRTLYNRDPSWDLEVQHFVSAIQKGAPIENGTSRDAFETMKLVYRIYHADAGWRSKFDIANPDGVSN